MLPAFLERMRRDSAQQTRLIYPWELPSIMRKHIVTGAMGTVYFALISGMFLVAFGNTLGLEDWQWGVLSSGASAMLAFQLVSAYVVVRTGNRKTLWYAAAMVSRMLRALAITVAFWLMGSLPGMARTAFILLIVVAAVFEAIASPPWFSWLADIIPHDQHGRFMGRRGSWTSVANILAVLPIGYLMDRVPEKMHMPALMGVFAFSFFMGVVDLVIHRTIPEPPLDLAPRQPFWQEIALPLRDPAFRPWLIFNAVWTFGMTLGGSLSTVYFVRDLGIRRNFFGGSVVLIMLPLLGTALASPWLGAMVDRYGVKKLLTWGHRFWALLPAFWIIATPRTALWWLGVSGLMGSVASTAAGTAASKLTTRLPEREHVAMYVAVSACTGSLFGAIGPLVAGFALQGLKDMSWTIWGFTFVGFHLTFAASLILRNLATLLIRRVNEPQPVPARAAIGRPAEGAPSRAAVAPVTDMPRA